MNIREDIRYFKELRMQNMKRPLLTYDNISYANWWRADPRDIWFTRFIKYYWPSLSAQIRFYSVFGKAFLINEKFSGIKIFFSGENLEKKKSYASLKTETVAEALWKNRYRQYGGYVSNAVDLAMGFGTKESEKYMRFPLWILYLFNRKMVIRTLKKRLMK